MLKNAMFFILQLLKKTNLIYHNVIYYDPHFIICACHFVKIKYIDSKSWDTIQILSGTSHFRFNWILMGPPTLKSDLSDFSA